MIIVGSGKSTTTYEEQVLREDNNATVEFSLNGNYNYDFPLYQSYSFDNSTGEFVAYSQIYSVNEITANAVFYRTNGANGSNAGSQLYKYVIVTAPNQNTAYLETVVNLTTYDAKANTVYEGIELTDVIIVDAQTGQQTDLETIKDNLGNILFQKLTAPEWFNYTGIDANGNYEGTTAYDGTPVAYGIGKPTITTADDGTETISWARANGLNDDYFIEKYGDSYVKQWGYEDATPLQVVEDVLVIPDTYKGLPVTTLLESSFYAYYHSVNSTSERVETQASFYKSVVFGKNITTIQTQAFNNISVDILSIPTTVQYIDEDICGFDTTDAGFNIKPIVQVNSNIVGLNGATGLYGGIKTVIFSENVTEVSDLLNENTTYDKRVWVFRQPADTPVTITFNSKGKTAQTVTIYTDNNSVKNYDWSTNGNITPTFYPLSDYTG